MSKNLFTKFFVLLLVVGLLFAVAPTTQAQAQTPSVWDGTYPAARPTGMADPVAGVQLVNTAEEFAWLASQTNMFAGGVTTVKLMVDIDLADHAWTPSSALGGGMANTFDGNGHTISNLSVNVTNTTDAIVHAAMFLQSSYDMPLIKQLIVDGADVTVNAGALKQGYAGVVASGVDWHGSFQNVTVKNSNVTGTKYVGGIASYNSLDWINCTVTNVTLNVIEHFKADGVSRDLPHVGALVGLDNAGQVYGNTVSNLTIIVTPPLGQPDRSDRIGTLIGTAQAEVLIGSNAISGVTLNGASYTKLIGLDNRTYKVINATQMIGYTTIQAAITAASAGNTIEVAPGTYNEGLTINKPLTVKSTGGAETTIISKDIIYVVDITASNVTFDGFTVKSPGYNAPGADLGGIMIGHYGQNNLTNIVVKNNIVTEIGAPDRLVTASDYPSVGIVVNAVINGLQITGNTIHDLTQVVNDNAVTYGPSAIGFYGYDVTPLSQNVVISGNTVYNIASTGTGTGAISNGIRAGWGSGDVTISGNTVHDIEGRAIAVTSANNGAATITNNTLSNAATGIYLWNTGGGVLSGNTFTNVGVEVERLQVHNVTQSKYYETIQAAIDAATGGDVIEVAAGTYAEDLEIGKSITILGPNAAISPNGGARVAEAILAPIDQVGVADPAVLITAPNITVTLKGLTFDMVNTTDNSDRFVESINKVGVTLVVEKNQFLNAPSCINGNWYITGTTNPFSLTLKDNYFYGSKDSNGISLWGDGHTVDIQNNVWKDNGAWAVNFNNVTGTFSGNQVLDTEDNGTEWSDEQAGFLFASANNLTLTNNTFDGLPNASIRIYPNFSGTLTATDNTFSNTEDATIGAIRVSDGANLTGVTFDENLFLNNPIVVQNLGTGTASLDVTPNWWGSIAGPTAAQLVGTTTFNPWCANAACTEFLPATVTIAPVAPVFCGVTPTSTIDINVAGIPASILAQGYQLTLHFDPAKTSIASAADIVQGGFLPVGTGFQILNIDNTNGTVVIASTINGTATNDSTKPLVKITLTHKGVAGDIALSLSDVLLPDNYDMLPIPVEVSTAPVVLTLNPAVLNTTKDPDAGYCDLASAVAAANAGDNLQLQADIAIPTTVTVDKAIMLDLNGKVASYTPPTGGGYALLVSGSGALTVNDPVTGGAIRAIGWEGRGINVKEGGALVVNGGAIQGEYASVYVRANSSMILNGGLIGGVNGPIQYSGIIVLGNGTTDSATLEVNGGEIVSYDFAISGNGTLDATTQAPIYGGTKITITAGTITSTGALGEAVYHPQAGTLNISGGTITGHQGVEMRSGTLNVTGGTIHAIGNYVAVPDLKGGWSTDTGDAIYVGTSGAGYAGNVVVNISGTPIITSDNGFALREEVLDGVTFTNTQLINVTGGTFTGGTGTDEAGAAVKFDTVDPAILKLTGGLYNTDPAIFVYSPLRTYAAGGGFFGIQAIPPILNVELNIEYFDLQTAVDAATAGNTLKFQLDYTIPATVTINKALTLNTNGKTISRTAAFTPNSANNSILVGPGGDVTITGGGTITATSGTVIRIEGTETTLAKATLVDATLYAPSFSVAIIGNQSYSTHATVYQSLFVMTGGHTNESVIVQGNGAEANITGGTLTGAPPVMGNGTVDAGQNINNGGTKITIGGTAVVGDPTLQWVAVYHPQEGLLTVNGGTIQGNNGIEMKAGDLVITGGIIKGWGAKVACADPTATGNGSTNTGDAILIFNRNTYGAGETIDVTISGTPEITSTSCYALREYTLTGETSRLGVATISGGTFTGLPAAVSFTTNTDANLDLLPGSWYNTNPAAFVYVPYGTYLDTTKDPDMYGIRLLPTISGLVTMQGRPTVRAGVPLALNATAYTDTSDDMTEVNYAFIGVELGSYTFTTDQPRYLNITATILVDSLTNRSLPLLRLLGGDVDGDDLIYVNDASIVGTAWGSTVDSSANINFDGVVNIQDLALVGGNYGQTSASAYGAWLQ